MVPRPLAPDMRSRYSALSPWSRRRRGFLEVERGPWERGCHLIFLTGDCCVFTTVFVDTRLWKTKHLQKRFHNFRQSYVLSTCRIEIRLRERLRVLLIHGRFDNFASLFSIDFDYAFSPSFCVELFSGVACL